MTEYQIVKAHVRKSLLKSSLTFKDVILAKRDDYPEKGYTVYKALNNYWFATFDEAYRKFCELSGWDDVYPDPDWN